MHGCTLLAGWAIVAPPVTATGWRSKTASAYTVGASFSYPGVFGGWDLEVPVQEFYDTDYDPFAQLDEQAVKALFAKKA